MVPGPTHCEQEPTWQLGAINPSGLSGKGSTCKQLGHGIFAVSETQLSSRGIPRFRRELEAVGSKFHYVPGAAAPLKYQSLRAIAGTHTGVGFLSSFPFRSINHGWNEEMRQSGRIHAATFQVGSQWIGGGVVYGQASQHTSPATKAYTNSLLSELTRQLVNPFPGPAFVAGDFNQEFGVLPETHEWIKRGWKELQSWAEDELGIPPGPTCKYRTRKDFVFLSPSLQQLIKSVSNEFDMFADHRVLQASLAFFSAPAPVPRWRKPKPLQLDKATQVKIRDMSCPMPALPADPTSQYQMACKMFEQHVDHALSQQGLSPLLDMQKGRACTMQREMVQPNLVQVKPSRHGEVSPGISDWSLGYKRWFTQLRRLVSLSNAMQEPGPSPGRLDYQLAVWGAVKRASGFTPTFVRWWNEQQYKHEGWPHLTGALPSPQSAVQMVKCFQPKVEQWEQVLKRQQAAKARTRRAEHPNMVFQDVRRPRPVPVQTVVSKSTAQITEVVDEASVIFTSQDAFNSIQPLEARTGILPIIHLEEEQVWFQVPHGLSVGDTLVQVEPHGSLDAVNEAFMVEWSKRWDRHRHVPSDRWEEICKLAASTFRPKQMQLQPITLDRWKRAIHSKKHTAATGMDAVSRHELLSMNDTCHEILLSILRQAEEKGSWPIQLLQGAVNSLEKVAGADTVSMFRPITVMPLAYRVWSSLRSQELLQFIVEATSDTMFGKPGSNATTLWWSLQSRLETYMYSGDHAIGIISDVVKAFNHLPREPVFMIAKSLGVHGDLLRAWSTATWGLKRHFFIQGSPSMPVGSCTGFVEGCGLSVASMALTNMLIHRYLEWSSPRATFSSYVDNFEIEANSIEVAEHALAQLTGFCELLDIQLDAKKTCWWAIHPDDRAALRATQRKPIHAIRDLGGHLQFTGQQGNATIAKRLKDLDDLWPKLAASAASKSQKLRVVRTVAWPRGLHGSSISHIGSSHFEHLRAQVMKSVGYHKAGANAQIQLALLEQPILDPEYVVIQDSVVQFRRHVTLEAVEESLEQSVLLPNRQKETRAHEIVVGPAERHWVAVRWRVGGLWHQRKDFEGLQRVSAILSRPSPNLTHEHKGILRSLMNGTLFTNDFQSKYEENGSRMCSLCGKAVDSMEHRHWQCEVTAFSRQQLSPPIQAEVPQLPECTRNRGWMQEPPALKLYRKALHTIPDTTRCFRDVSLDALSVIDLFVDGTGLEPGLPCARLVAWGVIVAGPTTQDSAQRLSSGGVPGQWQTVARAELMALLSAIAFAVTCSKPVRIWSDNQAVANRAHAISTNMFSVTNKIADHDLWQQVADLLAGAHDVTFQQIRSHQCIDSQPEWKQWAFIHNNLADVEAALALEELPTEVITLQQQVAREVKACIHLRDELRQHFIRVGTCSIQQLQTTPEVVEASSPPVQGEPVDFARVADTVMFDAPANLRFVGVNRVLDWLRSLTAPGEPRGFVSWYELLCDFQITTGIWGVETTSTHSNWQLVSRGVVYDGARMCRLLACLLTRMIRLSIPQFKPIFGRPNHSKFQCWTMGILVNLSKRAQRDLDTWLQAALGDRQISSVSVFATLPPASLHVHPSATASMRGGLHRYW
eukprot:Skav223455  [mRNA]  locus=scaffold184:98175:103062:- [translate_table: standard]